MMETSLGTTMVAKEEVGTALVKIAMQLRTRLPRKCRTGVRKSRSGG